MLNRQHGEAVCLLDLRKLALIIAKQHLKCRYGPTTKSQVAAIVKLYLGSATVGHPYLGPLSQRQIIRGRSPVQILRCTPGYRSLNKRKSCHPNRARSCVSSCRRRICRTGFSYLVAAALRECRAGRSHEQTGCKNSKSRNKNAQSASISVNAHILHFSLLHTR